MDTNSKKSAFVTLGGYFENWLVDYLFDSETNESQLCWRSSDGKIGCGKNVQIGNALVVSEPPFSIFTSKYVLFASQVGELKSIRELLAILEEYISSAVMCSATDRKIMAYFVLSTWVYDCFSETNYMRFMGPAGSGKSEFLKRIGMVMYRPMNCSFSSQSLLARFVDRINPTLLMDEMTLLSKGKEGKELLKILNMGSMKGIPYKPSDEKHVLNIYCPKIVAMRGDLRDSVLAARFITIKFKNYDISDILAARIPLMITVEMKTKAQEIRNLLMRWRLENWKPDMEVNMFDYEETINTRLNSFFGRMMAFSRSDVALQLVIREAFREFYANRLTKK